MFSVMYYRRGFQFDNGKDNDYTTFEEALDEALSEVERGYCDQFDIIKWEDEENGETYCIWQDGKIFFEKGIKWKRM